LTGGGGVLVGGGTTGFAAVGGTTGAPGCTGSFARGVVGWAGSAGGTGAALADGMGAAFAGAMGTAFGAGAGGGNLATAAVFTDAVFTAATVAGGA